MQGNDVKPLKVNILRGKSSADLADFLDLLADDSEYNDASVIGENRSRREADYDAAGEGLISPQDLTLRYDTVSHGKNAKKKEDSSCWFNYGFTESTFQSWIAWQLNNRHRILVAYQRSQEQTEKRVASPGKAGGEPSAITPTALRNKRSRYDNPSQ